MKNTSNQENELPPAYSDVIATITVPDKVKDHSEHRGQWGRSLEFLMSCISMSVGLGNVWRFPNIAYNNGGGAFLIPYLLLLFVIGRPLYYMELVLGQFSGKGPIKAWKCVPALKGLGYAQVISTSYLTIFYNYLMAVSVFYLIASMSSQLPWTTCDSSWAGDVCNETELMNRSNSCDSNNTEKRISLTELYFKNYVLHLSSGLQEVTMLNWKMCLCLIGAWTMVYFCVIKGVQSLGKVTYFTAIFPYTVLISLMVVALTFDGASDGIKYFFTPHWKKLLKIEVWYRACEQSFFSLAVGYGTLVMYSSYNEFRNNVNRDAIIISVLDTFTSILAGSVVFAVLGTLAHELCIPIEEAVDKEGMGLAFVAYPEALGKIKVVPQLWSVLFFVMLLTLGLGSSIAQVETILTSIKDQYPILQKKKSLVALCLCSVFCLCGLPLTTDAGLYIMTLLDNYGVGTAAFLYCIVETIGLMWIYGWRNFCDDIHFMLNAAVGLYWKVTWIVTAPVILTVIFIYGNVMLVIEKNSEGSSTIPPWGTAIGWVLAAVAIFQIPIWIMRVVYNTKGPQRLKKAFQPQEDWGPSNPTNFISWKTWKSSRKTVENVISAYQNEAFEKDETKF